MTEETKVQSVTVPTSAGSSLARHDEAETDVKNAAIAIGGNSDVNETAPKTESAETNGATDKQAFEDLNLTSDGNDGEDAEMAAQTYTDGAAVDDSTADPATATPGSKSKGRRKSAGIPEHKSKKLNKKASKVKMSHSDAKPGDYYFIRLKGYPLWPGIVCDESMLPKRLINSRPVTAARPDGTYRADYEDGGKKVHDRTFPVMYLYTNEFGWIPNYDLVDIDLDEVGNVDIKMRKDLYQAHKLAAERHNLDYFKQVLIDFAAAREAEDEAKAAAKAAKEAIKSARKSKKKVKASADADGEDVEDVEMADVDAGLNIDGEATEKKPKATKKRKAVADAEESSTPQPATSAKKLKFKPISTPKAANGGTPKSAAKKDSTAKPSKSKLKKSIANGTAEKAITVPKEPELSPEEKKQKKEKEILFLRHKLQKGLLTRDQQPKEEEMKQMSEFISKLEGYADLEVSIIRVTKINKVLKAILKLSEIPKEVEFKFKERSKSLLEKWNKILESADQPGAAATTTQVDEVSSKGLTNGVSAAVKTEIKDEVVGDNEAEEQITSTSAVAALPNAAQKVEQAEDTKPSEDLSKPSAPEAAAI